MMTRKRKELKRKKGHRQPPAPNRSGLRFAPKKGARHLAARACPCYQLTCLCAWWWFADRYVLRAAEAASPSESKARADDGASGKRRKLDLPTTPTGPARVATQTPSSTTSTGDGGEAATVRSLQQRVRQLEHENARLQSSKYLYNTQEKRVNAVREIAKMENEDTGGVRIVRPPTVTTFENLLQLDLQAYERQHNPVLMAMLHELSRTSSETGQGGSRVNLADIALRKNVLRLAAADMIAKARDEAFIGTLAFETALSAFAVSGSRSVVDLFGRLSACGSYSHLLDWMKQNVPP